MKRWLMLVFAAGCTDWEPSEVPIPDDLDGDLSIAGDDCDEQDPDVYPGAEEIPYDGYDQDCDGADLEDVDRDGYDSQEVGGLDCDDEDPGVHPGATDEIGDGVDEDCDGSDRPDYDDGFAGRSVAQRHTA